MYLYIYIIGTEMDPLIWHKELNICYLHMYIQIFMYTYTLFIHIYSYVYVYTYIHMYILKALRWIL
jgi:hypothetical protein